MYGQIENGKVVKILYSKPEWYYDDGSIITDEDLLKENVYPVDVSFNRAVNFSKETLVVNSLKNMSIDYKNKKIVNYFIAIPIPLEDIYNNKVREFENKKNELTYVNLSYVFPDNKFGIIQLRNENDLKNLNMLYTDSMFSITNNINKKYSFKDEANISHEMTAQQMSELGAFIKNHVDSIFLDYWNIKHIKLDTIYNNSSLSQSKKIDEILSLVW